MPRLTEEEAWALDDYVTGSDIELGPDGTGFLSQREARLKEYELGLDKGTITWLHAKAEASNQTIAQVISALVRKEIATTASA
jgi:hypothetical protein